MSLLIVLPLIAAGAAALLTVGARRRWPPAIGAAPEPAPWAQPEVLGATEGAANLPNSVTLEPFPTPILECLLLEGDRQRHQAIEDYLQRVSSRRVREGVVAARATHLAKAATGSFDPMTTAERAGVAAQCEQLLVGTQAALRTDAALHEARLKAIDAETEAHVARCWSANLRARDRREPALDSSALDMLKPPSPSEWRAQRALRDGAIDDGADGRDPI